MIGGVVIGYTDLNRISRHSKEAICDGLSEDQLAENEEVSYSGADALPIDAPAVFALEFPHEDLQNVMPIACKLQHTGYVISAFLYRTSDADSTFSDVPNESGCVVVYIRRSHEISPFSDWLDSLPCVGDVVTGLDYQDFTSATFSLTLEGRLYLDTTLMILFSPPIPGVHDPERTPWMGL
ncbi:hypothetical protein HYDPIDRAFT_34248 [Hydnomerulius pinastri MD-312]|uniref:Uncharacterized protein n=1 Tax=Hydnomerulius pinastri MD-312 TaxID=994086 RepID=A0A0C9W7G0_9AGAM|nr:hypothetical protein HYDPIDRAFT_34248 [Hydnomerulius pinastri MD-312]